MQVLSLPAHEKKVSWPTGPTPEPSSARRGLPHLHRCTTRALCMACSITDMCWVPGTDYQPLSCLEQVASYVQACAPWVCMQVCGSVTMALHAVGASIDPAIQPGTQTTMLCQCYSCMLTNVCCIRTLSNARDTKHAVTKHSLATITVYKCLLSPRNACCKRTHTAIQDHGPRCSPTDQLAQTLVPTRGTTHVHSLGCRVSCANKC